MSFPSDFSFSSYNPESEPEPQLPELETEQQQTDFDLELDDIPEDDDILALQEELELQDRHRNNTADFGGDSIGGNLPNSEDIRDAIEATKRENLERLKKAGEVIFHKVPKGIKLGFRSDNDFPESPSKRYTQHNQLTSEVGFDPRSSFTDPQFVPSSQQVPPSSPPNRLSADRESQEMENPFTMEEDESGGNPFMMQQEEEETSQNSEKSGTTNGQAAGQANFENPFSMETDANNESNGAGNAASQESVYDKAFNNPFSLEEEDPDEVPTPRLPAKTGFLSKPQDKENRDPIIAGGETNGTPFTLEGSLNEGSTSLLSASTQRDTSFDATPKPKPNQYTRVKIIGSDGEVTHLLQHPPNRLKLYRGSLVNQGREEEVELNATVARSQRKYYGIDIYHLKEAIKAEEVHAKAEADAKSLSSAVESLALNVVTHTTKTDKKGRKLLWTEKYRAKRFTDLLGDERTHRHILRWLKGWEGIVFGTSAKKGDSNKGMPSDEQRSRKILLVTGPPGLGKTTMAHVLARQAGYEPLEINASDDRTANVVKNRIKDVVGTETVHMGDAKRGKPVCVIIDEIDGVTGEGGGAEGGFIKALVDLIEQDKRNSGDPSAQVTKKRGKKGSDRFRFLRPIIAVCNDLYAPSLKTLRPLAEVVYTKRPPLPLVLNRLKEILEKEGVEGDNDAIRKIVELEGGHGNLSSADFVAEWSGDVRGIMVAGEWVCGRLRSAAISGVTGKNFEITSEKRIRMTKRWVEEEFSGGGGLGSNDGAGNGGRGNGVREVVEKVFLEEDHTSGASKTGNKQPLPGNSAKSRGIQKLRNLIEASGEFDKIMTDCFAKYPSHPFHDDPTLTKPNKAYEWMFMHDLLTSRVFGGSQDYELTPYLSTPVLGLHTLFATPAATSLKGRRAFGKRGHAAATQADDDEAASPFTGAKAEFEMREAQKANMSLLNQILGVLPHNLVRGFKPLETISYELAPWLVQIIQPKVNPILVGGKDGPGVASVRREAEKKLVERAVEVLAECNIEFDKLRVEADITGRGGGWLFRMEPPFDTLSNYKTLTQDTPTLTTRYAVRQVLDQELRKFVILQQEKIRQERFAAANPGVDIGMSALSKKEREEKKEKEKELLRKAGAGVKRDFFGRVIEEDNKEEEGNARTKKRKMMGAGEGDGTKIWCSFREGFSNAVKKPITWEELMSGL